MVSSSLSAQDFQKEKGIYYSDQIGLNFSSLSDEESKLYTGWHFGGLINYDISQRLTARTGLLYSSYGSRYENTIDGVKYIANYKMNTLRIPLEMSYYIENRFGITLGVAGVFNIDDKLKIKEPSKAKIKQTDTRGFLFTQNLKFSWRKKDKSEYFVNIEMSSNDVYKNVGSKLGAVSLGCIHKLNLK